MQVHSGHSDPRPNIPSCGCRGKHAVSLFGGLQTTDGPSYVLAEDLLDVFDPRRCINLQHHSVQNSSGQPKYQYVAITFWNLHAARLDCYLSFYLELWYSCDPLISDASGQCRDASFCSVTNLRHGNYYHYNDYHNHNRIHNNRTYYYNHNHHGYFLPRAHD